MSGKVCAFCGHLKDWHYVTKRVRPDGTPGGPATKGCAKCVCRKYEQ